MHYWILFLFLEIALLFHVLRATSGWIQGSLLILYFLYLATADVDNVFKLLTLRGLLYLTGFSFIYYFLPVVSLDIIFQQTYGSEP